MTLYDAPFFGDKHIFSGSRSRSLVEDYARFRKDMMTNVREMRIRIILLQVWGRWHKVSEAAAAQWTALAC